MFPSDSDLSDFTSRFGVEGVLHRSAIPPRPACGTTLVATVQPVGTPDETLERAWHLIRSMTAWLLPRAAGLPPTERYMLIVGWSKTTRPLQGQIFKAGGTLEDVQRLASTPNWHAWEQASGYKALLPNWQKDVFA